MSKSTGLLSFECFSCSTCTDLPPTSSRAIWRAMGSILPGAVKNATTRPAQLSGESQAQTGSTHSTSSFTRVSVYKTSHHLIYHLIYEISKQSITASEASQDFIFRGARLLCPVLFIVLFKIIEEYYISLFTGTRLIPCDFLMPVKTQNPIQNGLHHEVNICILPLHLY